MIRAIATAALEAALAWLRCQRAQCDLAAKCAARMAAQLDAQDAGTKGN